MAKIRSIIIIGYSGYGIADEAYDDLVQVTEDSISYDYQPLIPSEINPVRKWTYQTNSPIFAMRYDAMVSQLPGLIQRELVEECCDCGGIEVILQYDDQSVYRDQGWSGSEKYTEFFHLIRALVPACEYVPAVLLTEEDFPDEGEGAEEKSFEAPSMKAKDDFDSGEIRIRKACLGDEGRVAELAWKLWPHAPLDDLMAEFAELLKDEECAVFLSELNGVALGFAQCQLRHDYVEGTHTSPVGYLEGIYVDPAHRGCGVARALLDAGESWAKEKGCEEFASDCELGNEESIVFHQALGFTEANRIVCFTKSLNR